MSDEMQGLTTEVEIECINRGTLEVMLSDGSVHKMKELHSTEGFTVDSIDEAFFATVELPDGRWFPVILSNFEENGTTH